MKRFMEWLSDHLRYLMLALAALLFFILVLIGVRVWFYSGSEGEGKDIEIISERITEADSEEVSESGETESRSESEESDAQSENQSESEGSSETAADSGAEESEPNTDAPGEGEMAGTDQSQAPQTDNAPMALVQLEPETQTETETETETQAQTQYEPVYLTMQGACYIRSAPSYDGEILGTYEAGTVVEFLEDAGGWYKVRVDGMEGYMGARFFSQ